MSQLLEWSPLIVFFLGFKLLGIYWATGLLMATCVLVAGVHRLTTGRYKTMQVVTAGVALALGTATLVLHDERFIQWKPTLLLGAAAVAFFVSALFGRQPLAQRMLESVFDEPLEIPRTRWLAINTAWGCWFVLLAVANLYVARTFAPGVWVNFKVFGITAAMLVFMIPQVLWLSGKARVAQPGRS